ncbi:MAG: hypothetical protein CMM58_14840 [Rhodospirillaceae bacterium]|nr:hypothetical protein [Rhodospirillaceae bacterium]
MGTKIGRFIPISLLGVVLALAAALGWVDYLSIDYFQSQRVEIVSLVESHYFLSIFLFILLYVVTTALSIPAALILTIIGGYLFGAFGGAIYSITGASIGACILFGAARTAFGAILKPKVGSIVETMQAELTENAFFYLIFLRLIPAFPFFVVNLAPAFLNIKFSVFSLATIIGMVPGGVIYALIGSGLGQVLEMNGNFSYTSALDGELLAGLFGLAILSLFPVFYRRKKKKYD